MRGVFARLLESLNRGRRVAVVSEYHDFEIRRSLVHEFDAGWNSLGRPESGLSFMYDDKRTMIERYAPNPRLVVLGAGHIALPLSGMGASLGFQVLVFDDRPSFANQACFPDAKTVICDSFDRVTERIPINRNDYVIIITRGHRHDGQCLRSILEGEFPRYVGMIGSRRRVAIVKKQLEEETGEAGKLALVHAPIGLDIGAVTPGEIAVSILAEVIRERRLGSVDMGGGAPAPLRFISPDMELLTWLAANSGEQIALATVVKAEGSTPRETGAKMAILPHGQTIGSIGGGCAEAEVIRKAIDIIQYGGHCLIDIDLTDTAEEDGMVCGGVMKVLLEAV